MSKFVVADTHLDDEAILKHCRQQFCVENKAFDPQKPFEFHRNNPLMVTPEAMEAHNSLIKTNWNRMVGKKDKIVILGDFAFRNHAKHLSELNGHKILVRGTHDSDMPPEALAMFDEIHEWIKVVGAYAPRKLGGRMVYDEATVMCHYPMRSWPGSCLGSCHLYGHSHGALQEPDHLMAFDVGVDVWGYIPVTWDAISEKFRLKMESMGDKGYPLDSQDWTSPRQKDPLKRMFATREKNLAILKSIGIQFEKDGLVNMDHARKEKFIDAVAAVAGSVNRHGILYKEEALKKVVDNVNFFWDEATKSLIVRGPEAVIKNRGRIVELFKQRLQEVVPVKPEEMEGVA